MAALPPDGATIDVECSDAAIADELKRRFSQRPDTARARVSPLPRSDQPELMRVVSAVADVRREPSHASELVSQAVSGDAVVPLKREGDWVLARMDDGYIGWIRDWSLKTWSASERDAFASRTTGRIRANHAQVFVEPAPRALPLSQVVAGTPVAARGEASRGWIEVEWAGGKSGFVRKGDIEKTATRRPTAKRLAETGLRFLGIQYLWGGTTPNGFDCSGLVQRVFRLNGLLIPRDSDMQARFGKERRVEGTADLTPGDLLFFGKSRDLITHTGLVLPDGTFLHAYGQVIVNSLDKTHPRYDERLSSIWQMARNPLARARG